MGLTHPGTGRDATPGRRTILRRAHSPEGRRGKNRLASHPLCSINILYRGEYATKTLGHAGNNFVVL